MYWNVERMAEAGNRYAQFYLGWISQNVIDVAEDDLAVNSFRQGIELNKTMMYEGGRHGNEGKLQSYIGVAKQRIDVVLERGVFLEICRNMAMESSKIIK